VFLGLFYSTKVPGVVWVFGKFQSFDFIQLSYFLMCDNSYISFDDNVLVNWDKRKTLDPERGLRLSAKALDPEREILLPKSPPAALRAAVCFFFSRLC
jgi:hypothetical protein